MIREAKHDDLPQLLALWRSLEDAQRDHRVFPTRPDAEQRVALMMREAIDDPNAAVLVIDDESGLVGMAIAEVTPSGAHSLADAVMCELSRVVIAPARRGAGFGSMLVAAAEEFGRARGANWLSARLFSGNEAGRAFWSSRGFVPRYEQRVRPIAP